METNDFQTTNKDEVCVTFVIRADDPNTIAGIQKLIASRQASGSALVDDQTRLVEYQEFTPSLQDNQMLDALESERARVELLESRIADVERVGRVRAKEAIAQAEQRRVNLRKQLEDQYAELAERDQELRKLKSKYEFYAEIRDRCIKLRILKEMAEGKDQALAARLETLADRARHFENETIEVEGLIVSAKNELTQTVGEVQRSRSELEAEHHAAQQQLYHLHTHIEEQETLLDELFRKNEENIDNIIKKTLDEANMAKRTSNDRLQKLKIQALSLASSLSEHEFRANALSRTKRKLLHDFEILKGLRQRFATEQNQELTRLQQEIATLKVRLQDHRLAFGDNTVERIEAFEAQVKLDQSREWLARITDLRNQHEVDLQHAGNQFKESVEINSKQMGKLYADTIQREVLQFEDHKAVELKRADELRKRLAAAEERLITLKDQLLNQRIITAETRQRAREERAAKENRLTQLKETFRVHLKERGSPPDCIAFLRRAVKLHGSSPKIVAACEREVARLTFIKEMMPAVKRHFDGVKYFQRLKKSGLEASHVSEELDDLAISLYNQGIVLEKNTEELLERLDQYRQQFGHEYRYHGHVVREHLQNIQELLQSTGQTEAVTTNSFKDDVDQIALHQATMRANQTQQNYQQKDHHRNLPVLVEAKELERRSPERSVALQRAAAVARQVPPKSRSPSRRGIYHFNDLDETVAALGYVHPDRMFAHDTSTDDVMSSNSPHEGESKFQPRPASMGLNRRGSVKYGGL